MPHLKTRTKESRGESGGSGQLRGVQQALPCRGQPEATGLRPSWLRPASTQSESRWDRLSQLKLPRCGPGWRLQVRALAPALGPRDGQWPRQDPRAHARDADDAALRL